MIRVGLQEGDFVRLRARWPSTSAVSGTPRSVLVRVEARSTDFLDPDSVIYLSSASCASAAILPGNLVAVEKIILERVKPSDPL